MLTKYEKERIQGVIDQEGFDYGFSYYIDEKTLGIKDITFSDLWRKYREARDAFINYLEDEGIEEL